MFWYRQSMVLKTHHQDNALQSQNHNHLGDIDQLQSELTECEQVTCFRLKVFEVLMAQINIGVILVDERGQIRLTNSAVDEILDRFLFTDGLKSVSALEKFYNELRQQRVGDLQSDFCVQVSEGNALHIRVRGQKVDMDRPKMSGYILEIDDITDHY